MTTGDLSYETIYSKKHMEQMTLNDPHSYSLDQILVITITFFTSLFISNPSLNMLYVKLD